MDDADARRLEAIEGGIDKYRRLLKRWYEQEQSWERVAKELPFETDREWVRQAAQGDLESISDERIDAIETHMSKLSRDHEQAEDAIINLPQL